MGYVITFIFPAMLQLRSRSMLKNIFQVPSAKVRADDHDHSDEAWQVLLQGYACGHAQKLMPR
jgi:hypothetical protein